MSEKERVAVAMAACIDAIRAGVKAAKMTRDQRHAFVEAFKQNLGDVILELTDDEGKAEN